MNQTWTARLSNSPRFIARTFSYAVLMAIFFLGSALFPSLSAAQVSPKRPAASSRPKQPKKPMTQADVQKLWAAGDDTLFVNELKLRGLAFIPSGEWVEDDLPKLTNIPSSQMPLAAAALRQLVPPPPDLDDVAKEAPDLLNSLKAAAQKHSETEMAPLVDPALLDHKAVIYDIFDPTNFRAYSLGKPAQSEHGDVGMPFFELTTSNVEKLYYILFSQSKGKLIVHEIVTGPSVANLYLHDEELLAKSKLETMFRALNDGDQSGVKTLCTPGLYEAIQAWGGNKHPGDRLTRGHTLGQVAVKTDVALDQKSIRVVAKVSYPLSGGSNIVFFIDFERVGNELKVVRIRDAENKVVVYDPNIDNYLNRRYNLPDDPVPDPNDVAMTEEDVFLPLDKLHAKAIRALQYHDQQKIAELARLFVESNPTSGEGYGLRSASDLMQRKFEEADKDAHRALELNGTAYFILDRYQASARPFSPVVLGVSSTKIDYLPAPGYGNEENIPIASVTDISFAKGFPGMLVPGPFLKLKFRGPDGKKTPDYQFADFGTTCPNNEKQPPDLVEAPANGTCGAASTNGQPSGAYNISILTPPTWREDMSVVSSLILSLRGSSHK
jgi:hypothetical protein